MDSKTFIWFLQNPFHTKPWCHFILWLKSWFVDQLSYICIAGLATVIGIKYESPQNDKGKPALKVKSFVSDEYKNLVELAALHWDSLIWYYGL
jgi:hypothetical protein